MKLLQTHTCESYFCESCYCDLTSYLVASLVQVVEVDGGILEKPVDATHAAQMLGR